MYFGKPSTAFIPELLTELLDLESQFSLGEQQKWKGSERLRFSFLLSRFLHSCGKDRRVLSVALVLIFNIPFAYGVSCYL